MTPPDQEIPTPRTDAELFPAACCIPSMYPVVKREFCQMLEREVTALQKEREDWQQASECEHADKLVILARAEKAEKLYDNASAMFHEMQNKYYTLREDVKPLIELLEISSAADSRLKDFLSKHPELQ